MPTIRVAAVIVDEKEITLYKDDGETIIIPQGDPRVRAIIDTALPVVQNGGIAILDFEQIVVPNPYNDFEKKSSGVVRFFKIAKKFVENIFAEPDEAVAPTGKYGVVPTKPDQTIAAVNEIIANATPVSAPNFKEPATGEETIVAVVGDKVIPEVDQLKNHIKHGSKHSPKGLENFMQRLSKMIDQRPHSVQDLLRFIERADLPLADDGSIIAYKRLKSRGDHFVDCHTGLVKQRVGSLVRVAEDLVDRNRRNECSNGLHIARRAYLRTFTGDVLVLCKIEPEDVVVVPHNDPDKVRVCAYHILDEVTGQAKEDLLYDRPGTQDSELAKQVARALRGDYPSPIEIVEITQQQGGGVKITPVSGMGPQPAPAAPTAPEPTVADAAIDDPRNVEIEKKQKESEKVDPKAVALQTAKVSRFQEDIDKLNDTSKTNAQRIEIAKYLLARRKAAKKSWAALGHPGMSDEYLYSFINTLTTPVAAKPEPTAKAGEATKVSEGRKETARRLYETHQWNELWKLKQSAKVSFKTLGFSDAETEEILRNK